MKIYSIILSAGFSSRMGAFKPALKLGEKTALGRLIDANKKAGIGDIVVVTGHKREALAQTIENSGAVEAYNPDFDQGMFTSIQAGLAKVLEVSQKGGLDGVLLFLVDVPLISGETISQVVKSYRPGHFSVLTYKGKKGHPLLIPSDFIDPIMAYDGPGGLKGFTHRYQDKFIRIERDEEEILLDMDTPEDYQEILRRSQASPKKIEVDLKERIFLVRHGSTLQHREKIFMGQVDVPLSDKGRKEIQRASQSLKEMGLSGESLSGIYTSDLKRARESAQIIGEDLCGQTPVEIQALPEFREMSLGDWDGSYMEEIRRDFPQEYEDRGKNILFYKPPNAENYYDMTYRVQKKFKEILLDLGKGSFENAGGDLVIVAHKGVISAILALMEGLSPDQAWDLQIDRGSVHTINKGTYLVD